MKASSKRLKKLEKPEKIYLDNTNLLSITQPNVGTVRETFFLSAVSTRYIAHYPDKGDFLVDQRFLFEVGGKNKSFTQIRDIPDSYIAADEIEVGYGNKIPLWLFGMLY